MRNRDLRDLLLLVELEVPTFDINDWSSAQKEMAAKWAGAMHLRASDNDVRVPRKPKFLEKYPKPKPADKEA